VRNNASELLLVPDEELNPVIFARLLNPDEFNSEEKLLVFSLLFMTINAFAVY
jgi:hypothetical protein